MDPSTPKQVIHERVERVITELGLADVRHNRIGSVIQRGISGGQKRRVTLGAGLVTMPKILLLDEPTSGLDSRASYEVLQAGTSRSFSLLYRLDNLQEENSLSLLHHHHLKMLIITISNNNYSEESR